MYVSASDQTIKCAAFHENYQEERSIWRPARIPQRIGDDHHILNPYTANRQFNTPEAHPMGSFPISAPKCYPLAQFLMTTYNNAVRAIHWKSAPTIFTYSHSTLSAAFTYHGTHYTAIPPTLRKVTTSFLSIVCSAQIMASAAYQNKRCDHYLGDETEAATTPRTADSSISRSQGQRLPAQVVFHPFFRLTRKKFRPAARQHAPRRQVRRNTFGGFNTSREPRIDLRRPFGSGVIPLPQSRSVTG